MAAGFFAAAKVELLGAVAPELPNVMMGTVGVVAEALAGVDVLVGADVAGLVASEGTAKRGLCVAGSD